MKTQGITLEQLAEKLNKSVWEKGDLKRIYLNDAGYNTKKMSTKTFIYEKDGEFVVSCRIDCPSQPYQWISSQEEEVKGSIYEDIEKAIEQLTSTTIYCLVNPDGEYVDEFDKVVRIDQLYDGDFFYTEEKALKSLEERNESLSLTIKEFDKEKFLSTQDDCGKIVEKNKIKNEPLKEEPLIIEKQEEKKEFISSFEIGAKYEHSRFGMGICKSEDENKVWMDFSGEEKMLLKKFAPLKKVE